MRTLKIDISHNVIGRLIAAVEIIVQNRQLI